MATSPSRPFDVERLSGRDQLRNDVVDDSGVTFMDDFRDAGFCRSAGVLNAGNTAEGKGRGTAGTMLCADTSS